MICLTICLNNCIHVDVLEENWQRLFSDLSGKVYLLLETFSSSQKQKKRHVESVFSDNEDSDQSSMHGDVLSLQNSDHESQCQSLNLVKDNNNNLSEAAKNCLFKSFGEDAVVHKESKKALSWIRLRKRFWTQVTGLKLPTCSLLWGKFWSTPSRRGNW